MGRPSRNLDKRLLKAGRKLLPSRGIAGLSIRQVAEEAGVNLGMFHYHFKTKEAFVRQVLEDLYEEFFRNFQMETSGDDSPLERLRRALRALGRFSREQRDLLPVLVHDVMEGGGEIVHFAKANIPRHARIIMDLIRQCQKQGLIRKLSLPLTISFLAGSVAAPQIVIGMAERVKVGLPLRLPLMIIRNMVTSDQAIATRVDMALLGLGAKI